MDNIINKIELQTNNKRRKSDFVNNPNSEVLKLKQEIKSKYKLLDAHDIEFLANAYSDLNLNYGERIILAMRVLKSTGERIFSINRYVLENSIHELGEQLKSWLNKNPNAKLNRGYSIQL